METLLDQPKSAAAQKTKSNCELDAVHALKKINYSIRSKEVEGNTALTLLEMGCYISTAFLIYLAFNISSSIFTDAQQLSKEVALAPKIKLEKMMGLLAFERTLLISFSILPILFVIAIRKLKKKNKALGYAKTKAKDFLERYNLD